MQAVFYTNIKENISTSICIHKWPDVTKPACKNSARQALALHCHLRVTGLSLTKWQKNVRLTMPVSYWTCLAEDLLNCVNPSNRALVRQVRWQVNMFTQSVNSVNSLYLLYSFILQYECHTSAESSGWTIVNMCTLPFAGNFIQILY